MRSTQPNGQADGGISPPPLTSLLAREKKTIHSIHQGTVPPRVKDLLERTVQELADLRGIRHAVVGVESGDRSYG